MFQKIRHSRAGFTLVELLVGMTILSIMGAMTLLVYFQISENSRRLQLMREVSETARQITERIAEDVKRFGVVTTASENGKSELQIKTDDPNTKKLYIFWEKNGAGMKPMVDCKAETAKCSLFLQENTNLYNLADSFRQNEDAKRVKITDLNFYVSGGDDDAKKITLKMTVQLVPRVGISAELANSSKLDIQTTFSERPYKIN